jgi:hypothetical protein
MEFPERISEKITAAIAAQLDYLPEEKLSEINYHQTSQSLAH